MRLNLQWRLVCSICALIVLPFLLMGWFIAGRLRASLTEQLTGTLVAEAEGFALTLGDTLSERENDLRTWAEDGTLRDALKTGAYAQSDRTLTSLQGRFRVFRGVALFSADGSAVSASSPGLLAALKKTNASRSGWFANAVAGKLT